jgi:hypothetical protein
MRLLHDCNSEVLVKACQLLCCQQAQLCVEGGLKKLLQGLLQLLKVLSTHMRVKVHSLDLIPAQSATTAAVQQQQDTSAEVT